MTSSSSGHPLKSTRRAERLRRELAFLEQMDGKVSRKMIGCAAATIAAFAFGFLGLGVFLHIHLGLLPALLICVVLGFLSYWASRYQYGLAWMMAVIVVAVILGMVIQEGGILGNLDLLWPSSDSKTSKKVARQKKIAAAIDKRKLRLKQMMYNT